MDLLELSHREAGLGHGSEPEAQACLPLLLTCQLHCLRAQALLNYVEYNLGVLVPTWTQFNKAQSRHIFCDPSSFSFAFLFFSFVY